MRSLSAAHSRATVPETKKEVKERLGAGLCQNNATGESTLLKNGKNTRRILTGERHRLQEVHHGVGSEYLGYLSKFPLPSGGNPLVKPTDSDLFSFVPIGGAGALGCSELARVWIADHAGFPVAI